MNKLLNNNFWFGQIPVEIVCLYRTGFGLLLCAEAITWLPHTTELFSNEGFHIGPWSTLAPPAWLALGLCLFLVAASFALAIGFKTRTSLAITLAIWNCFFLIDHINEKAWHSIAIVNLIILFFCSSNARLSLDDFLRRKKGQVRLPATIVAWPFRLLQIQIVQVYFFSGLVKLYSNDWANGTTLKQIFASRWATDFGVWVTGWMPDAGFYLMSASLIIYEIFAGILLFIPGLRQYAVIFGVTFHVLSLMTLYVGYLALHYIWALIILFIEPSKLLNALHKFFNKTEPVKDARI